MHYKPTPDHLQQVYGHETVQQNDDDPTNNDWQEVVTIADYEQRRPEFSKMLEEFEYM